MFAVDMAFSLPNPNSPTNGDSGNADPVRQNFQAIAAGIQSFDGSQVQSKTIAESALADAINPRLRDSEILSSFVVPGASNNAVLWSVISGLNAGMTGGSLYVQGYRVNVAAIASRAFTNNLDTYVDIDYLGNVSYPTASNNAAAPALTANSVRVAKASAVSGVLTITTRGVDGIGNTIRPTGAITSSQIDFEAIGAGKGVWGYEIGRVTLSTAAKTMSIPSLPAYKYLRIKILALDTGGTINVAMQFNGDTSTNYVLRQSGNGSADATAVNTTSVGLSTSTAAQPSYIEIKMINLAFYEKMGYVVGLERNGAGSGSVPSKEELTFKWANVTNQITSVTVLGTGTGNYAPGSEVIVEGHN